MKVAIVGPTFPFRGGISHYTTLLAARMREGGEVLLVSYRRQYPRLLFPGRTQLDDSRRQIRTDSERLLSFADPLSWLRAARRIVEFGPDALIFSWVNPALAFQFRYISGFVKRRLPGITILFWCHNVTQHERLPMARSLTRLAFHHGDHFIVTGERSRDEILELCPGSAVTVRHLPELGIFASGVSRQQARRELGLEAAAPIALYFGFVRRYKGLVHLLRAVPAAAALVPGLQLMVVGEFWDDVSEYLMEIARLGIEDRVTVVDRYVSNEEVPLYFAAADLVVLPYETATGSGVVQVAYSFSRPVLTTTVGSLPEVVDEGKTGYLVPPGDPGALAEAIARFFNSRHNEDFAANIEAARPRFSWNEFVESVEEICGSRGSGLES
jgi:glycosyltransferase involved in cell wall biosynthesis